MLLSGHWIGASVVNSDVFFVLFVCSLFLLFLLFFFLFFLVCCLFACCLCCLFASFLLFFFEDSCCFHKVIPKYAVIKRNMRWYVFQKSHNAVIFKEKKYWEIFFFRRAIFFRNFPRFLRRHKSVICPPHYDGWYNGIYLQGVWRWNDIIWLQQSATILQYCVQNTGILFRLLCRNTLPDIWPQHNRNMVSSTFLMLLQLRTTGAIHSISTPAAASATRFFAIAWRLPMELQMILCHQVVGSANDSILSQYSEAAFKSLARTLLPSESK